jgi:hypothetical protein
MPWVEPSSGSGMLATRSVLAPRERMGKSGMPVEQAYASVETVPLSVRLGTPCALAMPRCGVGMPHTHVG